MSALTHANNSTKLIGIYKKFLSNLGFLIKQLKLLRKMLFNVEKALLISKRLNDKLNDLYDMLVATNISLLAMSGIPYVGPVAKVVQKVVAKIKKVVQQAKTKVNKLERKIKPHREKIRKFRGYIDKILKPLLEIERFIQKEEKCLSATYESNKDLPDSRYKNISLDKLHRTSAQLNAILVAPLSIIAKVTDLLKETKALLREVNKLCDLVNAVIEPIVKMMDELDRVTGVLKSLSKALKKKVSVNLIFYRFSLSIEKVLNAAGNIPGLSVLTKLATNILKPILNSLGLKVDNIPGLGGGVDNLGAILGKLNVIEKIKHNMMEQFETLTGKEKPQNTFKGINA